MDGEQSYNFVRKHKRFSANPRALVLVQDENDKLPFHIIKIGEGGLSFRYLGGKYNYSETFKISLYFEDQLIVDSIPAKPVSDFRLQNNLVPVRCGNIRFIDLEDEQRQKLDYFIQNYSEE